MHFHIMSTRNPTGFACLYTENGHYTHAMLNALNCVEAHIQLLQGRFEKFLKMQSEEHQICSNLTPETVILLLCKHSVRSSAAQDGNSTFNTQVNFFSVERFDMYRRQFILVLLIFENRCRALIKTIWI